MGWPYAFVTLTDEDKLLRRDALAHHAAVAHWSALAPALLVLLARVARRVTRRLRLRAYAEVPGSPAAKARRRGWAGAAEERARAFAWWAAADVWFLGAHWGRRDEWLVGALWTAWLLVLCVRGTGRDYLHLTKRFGIIATSQMPIQYLLSLKALNPFAYLLRSSHEQLNRFHRVLGRVIYLLLCLHALFYNVFFVEAGIWSARFFAPVVFAGVAAFAVLHALGATSVARVRRFSYRLFFITHLAAAFAIPVLIYFHAASGRVYVIEAVVFFVLDLGVRKITTITAPSVVETIPGTNLLKITASMPLAKVAKYRQHPGAHIYLSIPPTGRPSTNPLSMPYLLYEFLYNPFSVVSINEESGNLTLVARAKNGPVSNRLVQFAQASASTPASSPAESRVSLCIEGPYGAASKVYSELADSGIDRILLVAGGIGATFIMPVYHALQRDALAARIQLVWAIRSAADATWPVPGSNGKTVIDDDQVQLFLTGDMGVSTNATPAADGQEMSSLRRDPAGRNQKRPDFDRITNDVFRHGSHETVAVLVCGPNEMARDLRKAVTPWVMKGRKVWWHDESFGW